MTYRSLTEQLSALTKGFFAETVGYSTFGAPINAYHAGSPDGAQLIVQGAIHAREYVTAPLTAMLLRYASENITRGGIYFVPLVNPDGARLVLDGADFIPSEAHKKFLISANGSADFRLYKANGNAVDLNNNFPADWGLGKGNVREPAPQGFVGYYPVSERETAALTDFTLKVRPAATLSIHTKGEVIYYGFHTESPVLKQKSRSLANKLAAEARYLAASSEGSAGGYKDWCVETLKIPAFTVECGADTLRHPIGTEHLDAMFQRIKNLPLLALAEVL